MHKLLLVIGFLATFSTTAAFANHEGHIITLKSSDGVDSYSIEESYGKQEMSIYHRREWTQPKKIFSAAGAGLESAVISRDNSWIVFSTSNLRSAPPAEFKLNYTLVKTDGSKNFKVDLCGLIPSSGESFDNCKFLTSHLRYVFFDLKGGFAVFHFGPNGTQNNQSLIKTNLKTGLSSLIYRGPLALLGADQQIDVGSGDSLLLMDNIIDGKYLPLVGAKEVTFLNREFQVGRIDVESGDVHVFYRWASAFPSDVLRPSIGGSFSPAASEKKVLVYAVAGHKPRIFDEQVLLVDFSTPTITNLPIPLTREDNWLGTWIEKTGDYWLLHNENKVFRIDTSGNWTRL